MKAAARAVVDQMEGALAWAMQAPGKWKWLQKPGQQSGFAAVATWAARELGSDVDAINLTVVFWGTVLKASSLFHKSLQDTGVKPGITSVSLVPWAQQHIPFSLLFSRIPEKKQRNNNHAWLQTVALQFALSRCPLH